MNKKSTIARILKLKDSRKKEIELEVKKASDRIEEENSKLESLQREYIDKLDIFEKALEQGLLNASSINLYYDFFTSINGKIEEQKKRRARCKSWLESLQMTLVDAHKDKKVFEILNDKKVKEEKRRQAASEQKEFDFMAISRRVK